MQIILNKNINVVVASFGGVGTSFLMEFISKFKNTNSVHDADGIKHSPIPPISLDKKVKFIYVYGNPEMAVVSLFNRNFQIAQSKKLQSFVTKKIKPIPIDMSLDKYSSEKIDLFLLENHFNNWYDKYLNHETMFIKYEKIHDYKEAIIDYLELPKDSLESFPKRKIRVSKRLDIPSETIENLKDMYGGLTKRFDKMDDFEIRNSVRGPAFSYYLEGPYRRALFKQSVLFLLRPFQSKSPLLMKKIRTYFHKKNLNW